MINILLGSGVFLLPEDSLFSNFTINSFLGYIFCFLGFMAFSYIFSTKEKSLAITISETYGKGIAFFVSWIYWLVSCLCSTCFINSICNSVFQIFNLK